MASLRTRLLITLLYSASFDFPLTTREWVRRLYGEKNKSTPAFVKECFAAIVNLHYRQKIYKNGSHVYPRRNSGTENPAVIRAQRLSISQNKLAEIVPLITFCRRLPWVKGVAITGSAAVDNARENDDVDFMIVCAPHRLWLVRPLLIFFSQLYGKRRTWHGEEGNSWCFNLWLETTEMQVPRAQHSLYTAYEVCQTRWIISKENTKELFFLANNWVDKILPFLYLSASQNQALFKQKVSAGEIFIISDVFNLLNYLLFKLQHNYMYRRMTRERVSLHFAAFHPRDTKTHIFQKMHIFDQY